MIFNRCVKKQPQHGFTSIPPSFSMMKSLVAATFLTLVVAASAVQVATLISRPVTNPSKCSCSMPTSVQNGYESDTTPVFKAEAVEHLSIGDPHYSYTAMRVKVVFRGCAPGSEYIAVKSPKTTAACGMSYTPGTTYAVTAKLSRSSTPPPGLPTAMEVYTATSCSYNKEWTDCPYDDKVFLYYSPVRGCPTN